MVLRRLPRLDFGAADSGVCIYGVNSGFLLCSLAIDLVAVPVVCNDTLIAMADGLLDQFALSISMVHLRNSMKTGILTIDDAR